MTLAEKIKRMEEAEMARINELKTIPFTEEEKEYWSEYILKNIKNGCCNIKNDLYSKDKLFDDDKMNSYRDEALIKWLGEEGLYAHFMSNSNIAIYTRDEIDRWAKSLKEVVDISFLYIERGYVFPASSSNYIKRLGRKLTKEEVSKVKNYELLAEDIAPLSK